MVARPAGRPLSAARRTEPPCGRCACANVNNYARHPMSPCLTPRCVTTITIARRAPHLGFASSRGICRDRTARARRVSHSVDRGQSPTRPWRGPLDGPTLALWPILSTGPCVGGARSLRSSAVQKRNEHGSFLEQPAVVDVHFAQQERAVRHDHGGGAARLRRWRWWWNHRRADGAVALAYSDPRPSADPEPHSKESF